MEKRYKTEVAKLVARSLGWMELPPHYVPTPAAPKFAMAVRDAKTKKWVGVSKADADRVRQAIGLAKSTGKRQTVRIAKI